MNFFFNKLGKTVKEVKDFSVIKWTEIPPREGQITRKIIENFNFKNQILGDMFVQSKRNNACYEAFKTTITDRFGKPVGEEIYAINEKSGDILGLNIEVNKQYRQKKGFRFGEVLRLASIMEMIENKASHIKIVSKDTAVYFHSKYKFVPDFREFSKRDKILQNILKENSPEFSELKEEAEKIIEEVSLNKENAAVMRELTKKTNELLKRYIQQALKSENPQKEHPLSECIDMILTRENVLSNKDFFNSLFKKHGINYSI
ncbi:MAG: hypothetical protein KHX03_04050 [Clostridium sp.]|nr:hypothetical protein [Clostridium sp.]